MKKNNTTIDPQNIVLDLEEQLIEKELQLGNFVENENFAETKEMLEEAAKQHVQLNTTKPITIRVNQLDLIKLKAKAKRLRIPYQTLLSALISQYADDKQKFTI